MKAAVLLVVLSACTVNQRVGVLTVGAMASLACDYRQTVTFSDHGRWDLTTPNGDRYVEGNPLLGQTPSLATLTIGLAVSEVAVGAVALSRLPPWMKYAVLGATVAAETFEIVRAASSSGVCGGRR